MSGLLLRVTADGALRSVGDRPNGIVGLAAPQSGATWIIDGGYQPPERLRSDRVTIQPQTSPEGIGPGQEPVDAIDIVNACESVHEAVGLMQLVAAALRFVTEHRAACLDFESIATFLDLAFETRSACANAGYFSPRGGDGR